MAEFPPNVDDARLWLPSDTFFNDVVPSEFSPHQSRFSSMDDLAHHLAALTLLKQRRSLRLQRFRPPVPTGQLDFQSQCYLTGFSRTELCHHYPFPNPVQLQIGDGGFLEPRARALRRHHNQAQIRNQNRLFQFQGNGIGPTGGAFERVSGGTGVFHPRVLDSTKTTRSVEVKKKPGERFHSIVLVLVFVCFVWQPFFFPVVFGAAIYLGVCHYVSIFVKPCEDVIMYSTVFKVYFSVFARVFRNKLYITFVLVLPPVLCKKYQTSWLFQIFDKVETSSFAFLVQKRLLSVVFICC